MTQTQEECLTFLKEAKETLEELKALTGREKQLAQREEQMERSLAAEKKRMADTIQQTVKKRREEIQDDYDKETGRLQDQLKKVRGRREKDKNQRMKERIADDTAALHRENRDLWAQLKALVKKQRLPFYCRSPLYYSLYFPHRLKEYLQFLLFVAVAFVGLPGGVWLIIPEHKIWQLVLIYLADLVVFGGIFIGIGNRTKMLYMESLRQGRKLLDQIQVNEREIRRITAGIRRDRNEALYNLQRFDDEISRLQQELDEVAGQKKEALNTYESVTKTILTDGIERNFQESLEKLQQEYEQAEMDLKIVRQQIKEKRLYVADHYNAHLGKEFMDPGKIGKLCLIVQEGKALTVSEAIEVYRREG